jgi:hypothetical protein
MSSSYDLRTVPLDVYGGFVPPGQISMPVFLKTAEIPTEMKRILGWHGYVSSFGPSAYDAINKRPSTPGMHVDAWISTLPLTPGDKQAKGIFGKLGCGDSGAKVWGEMYPPPYGIPLVSRNIYIGTWAHNMRATEDDFHAGFVLFY